MSVFERKYVYQVIVSRGGFYASLIEQGGTEAHASARERKRMLRERGTAGLTEGEARGLARRLDAARARNNRARRRHA